MEAIESLKKMIKSWLDDTFPEMPEANRSAMAESMDVSMVERKKEESMKTFYEINNVIRMSFIEMQYMKKECQNMLFFFNGYEITNVQVEQTGNDECNACHGRNDVSE
jgi:hypothetical protein